MSFPSRASARALLAAVAVLTPAAIAAPASAAIVINEVESDGAVDFIELKNTGGAAVDIGGYVLKDNNNGNSFTIPAATSVDAGGYFVANALGFGLGSADSARVFEPGDLVTPIDSYSWTDHAGVTFGRCPDGTGAFVNTTTVTAGAANDCSTPPVPLPAETWPGATAVSTVGELGFFGSNLSGLAYQPSGTSAPGVLWAVRNGPSTLFRLVHDGTTWVPDTANGWAAGKTLVFPDGGGVPDAEGVTLASGDAGGVFVSIERNDLGGFANTSRPGVLRFDVTGAGTTLTATRDWNLSADIPGLGANAGLEAVTWVPDSLLTAKGFKDESTGAAYNPATHPNHGNGLFFVGVEADGRIIAYALNQSNDSFTRVAAFASGFPKIMDLAYDPETTHLWAVCDDTCEGKTSTFDIATSGADAGKFVISHTYARPAGMANLNNEGFTITPQAECSGGLKPVFWADDSQTGGYALRTGKLNCTEVPKSDPPKNDPPVNSPPVGGGATPQQPILSPAATVFKPVLAALPAKAKPSKKGRVAVTVSCTAVDPAGVAPGSCEGSLKLTAKIGKKTKTLATATFKLAAGKAGEVSLKLSATAKSALKKGSLKATATATVGAQTATKPITLKKTS